MIPSSDKLADYVRYFFTCYLPQHRDVSPHTLSSYKQTFIQLLRYCKIHVPDQVNPNIDQFQVGFLLDFLAYLEKELGNTAATRNLRLAALKSFFRMVSVLQPRYQSQCWQILLLPQKRSRKVRFDFLDKEEVDAVFASVDTGTHDGYRDLCILRTLYNTGARASEVCNIHIPDLNLDQKEVLIHGKGRKTRTVPLWETTTVFLRTYLKSERRTPLTRYQDFLFINQRRTRMTRSGVYRLCSQYLAEATRKMPTLEKKKFHPVHGWRRTTASHLGLAGVDLTVIQEWLGHSSIDTTSKYKGIPIKTKREALRKFYLFEQSWKEETTAGVDWKLSPDLIEFLKSL
jgi:site-specific recombinase XerD